MAANTKQRILDAAERMFVEHGYAGTSLRAIVAEAGVNLAAVNYHFRSKEELLKAVLARRLEPVNEERMRMLDVAEMAAAPKSPPVEDIVEAMLFPMLRMQAGSRRDSPILRVLGLLYGESGKLVRGFFAAQMREVIQRVHEALCRSLPGVPRTEVAWRMFFTMGAVIHLLRTGDELRMFSGGLCDTQDTQSAIPRLIAYVSAGLRAPLGPGQGR